MKFWSNSEVFFLSQRTSYGEKWWIILSILLPVLCTAPWKYRIIDPEGSIKPHCCVDIVIRHNSIEPTNFHVTDKFRIQMIEHSSSQILGKKDLVVTLLPGKSNDTSTSSQENFKHFSSDLQPNTTDIGAIKTHPLESLSKPG